MIVQESDWLNEFASLMFLRGCSNVCYRNSFSCLGTQEYLVCMQQLSLKCCDLINDLLREIINFDDRSERGVSGAATTLFLIVCDNGRSDHCVPV